MRRRWVALASNGAAAAIAVSGCLRGPALPVPTPKPKASATAKPAPTPSPTLPPGATPSPLKSKTLLAWVAVEFGAGNDIVAVLRNLSSQPVDLSTGYQLCGGEFVYGRLSPTKTTIPASSDVRVHVNTVAGCTESATEFCAEAGTGVTAASGNLALYSNGGFTDPKQIVDFVEWGGAGKAREDVAEKAEIWVAGKFVAISGSPASISVKVPGASGADNWQ